MRGNLTNQTDPPIRKMLESPWRTILVVYKATAFWFLSLHSRQLLYPNQSLYYMRKHNQTLQQQLNDIIDRSVQFHRYLALIKLLDNKKTQAESQLQQLMEKFKIAKANLDTVETKKTAQEVIALQKSIYGFSKQKIDVCKQFQELVDILKSELTILSQNYHKLQEQKQLKKELQKSESSESNKISSQSNSLKSKIKQRKMNMHIQPWTKQFQEQRKPHCQLHSKVTFLNLVSAQRPPPIVPEKDEATCLQ